MAIRVTVSEMASDVCSAYAVEVSAGEWRIGPVGVFGLRSRERLFTRDLATTAMVLAELVATGYADSDRYRRLTRHYSTALGLGE
jgi:hypothetical protein